MSIEFILEVLRTWLVRGFNPAEVFSSVQSFLGSGYIGIIALALITFSVMSKLLKLLGFAIILFCVYAIASSANIVDILNQLQPLFT